MKMVKNVVVNWQQMDGSTDLVKQLNSLLTSTFIGKHDYPSDECFDHATTVLALFHSKEDWKPKVVEYLRSMFAKGVNTKTGKTRPIPSMYLACDVAADRIERLLRGGPWPDRLTAV